MSFPKLIFQTWKTADVPAQWRAARQSVVDLNPGWTHVLLTDDDNERIVRHHLPGYLPHFKAFPHAIQRADAIRYIAMYLWGGVYLDLDYVALRSFDGIRLDAPVGLLRSNNARGMVTNSFLVSLPRCPFWLACLEASTRPAPWWAVTKHLEVFHTTGPFMLNRVFIEHPRLAQVLDVSVPCDVCSLQECRPTTGYFVMPIAGSSWHAWDSALINWVFCNRTLAAVVACTLCLACCVCLVGRTK